MEGQSLISEQDRIALIQQALKARQHSYAPYSHYQVGAALLSGDHKIYTGCNIENAAFGPTVCAERTAFFKAVSEGIKQFRAIAIVGSPEGEPTDFAFPCGVCRQVMSEFCEADFEIITAVDTHRYHTATLGELLPHAFQKW